MNFEILKIINEENVCSEIKATYTFIYLTLVFLQNDFSEDDLLRIKSDGADVVFLNRILPEMRKQQRGA